MFTLLTTYFNPKTEDRLNEFKTCFEMNIANNFIDKIIVFAESDSNAIPSFLKHDKVNVVSFEGRPKYSDFFKYAADNLEHGKTIIIANTDIYFDETIALASRVNFSNILACVSRWNIDKDGSKNLQGCGDSHDVWIFKNPISFPGSDIFLGISGCDTLLAIRASANGYTLINPSLSIIANHLHFSVERNNNLSDGLNYWHAPDYDCGVRLPFMAL